MLELKGMNDLEFDEYLKIAVKDFAKDKVEAGTWKEAEAIQLSEESFARLLPNKTQTKNEYLYCIYDGQEKVGYLWFHYEKEVSSEAFIYDFLIFEPKQNSGYGTKALEALDVLGKKRGIKKISLHVFAHNKRAVHVYEKLGFYFTDHSMSKDI